MYACVEEKLNAGGVVILDGGTGTEIQRLGAPMDSQVWCAQANLTHPEIVRQVHESYVKAGVDVITANTFASSPILLAELGREADIAKIDKVAVALAREAAATADRPIAIAGSFSVMRQVIAGTDRPAKERRWPEKKLLALLKQKAETLAETGCDLIIMEMMRDVDVSLWATEAAVATGLPVWVGISVERREDGRLAGFGDHKWTLTDTVPVLMASGAQACLVMHSDVALIPEALSAMRTMWAGPIGAYPEVGHLKMPEWQFADLDVNEFVEHCRQWRRLGASILGGCCGIKPDHIAALAEEFGVK